MTVQTMLIGIDGGTFTVFDPLMAQGIMPFLREFTQSGARAELRTIVPALTPPAWTSLATGRTPGHHGIFDFFRKETPESVNLRFTTSQDVGVEPIWSSISRYGLRATVLNFPLTFPPPPMDGYLVPGWMPWRQLRLGCQPRSLYDELKILPGFNARELAMDMSMEEKALEGCGTDEYEAWIELHMRRELQWLEILRYLVGKDPTELVAVLLDGADKLQHLCWRFIDQRWLGPSPSPWEQRVRERCLDYYRTLDRVVAELVALAGPEATVVIASDHGFGAQTGTFFVNAWLEQQGYLHWSNGDIPIATGETQLGIGQLARHVYQIDWEHTRAFAPTPSGNGIFIVMANNERPGGVRPDEYEQTRAELASRLLAASHPQSGELLVSHVWPRDEVFDGPYKALAPDLTLELSDGGLVSILAADVWFRSRPQPSGTHRPQGIFIARGPQVLSGRTLDELSILDVAPLLLLSLGLPIPDEYEGRLPQEALTPAALQAPRAAAVPTMSPRAAEPHGQNDDDITLDEEAQAEILRRMRALGYVE